MQRQSALAASGSVWIRILAFVSIALCFVVGALFSWSPAIAIAALGVTVWGVMSLLSPTLATLTLIAYTSLHPVFVKVVYNDHALARVWKDGAVLWLMLVWVAYQLTTRRGRSIRWGVTETWLILFVAITFLHLFNPNIYSFSAALADVRWLALPVLFYFLGKTLFDGRRASLLVVFLGILSAVHAVYGLVQQILPYSWLMQVGATAPHTPSGTMIGDYTRSFSTMDPYLFGALMSFGTVFAISMTKHAKTPVRWAMVALLTTGGAIFSLARYAWVMWWVGCVAMGAWTRSRLAISLAVAGVLMLLLPLEGLWRERRQDVINPLAPTSTVSIRVGFWKRALSQVWQYPFGMGLGTLGIGRWSEDAPRLLGYTTGADNNYLYILVETGWVGLTVYLSALVSILLYGGRAIRAMSDHFRRSQAAALWSVVLLSAIGNLVNFSTFLPPISWSLWCCAGALMSMVEGDDSR